MRVVVLGSGVVGVTSAYYLARAGHEVTVIDREAGPALETSFANAGQISPGYASPWAAPGRAAEGDQVDVRETRAAGHPPRRHSMSVAVDVADAAQLHARRVMRSTRAAWCAWPNTAATACKRCAPKPAFSTKAAPAARCRCSAPSSNSMARAKDIAVLRRGERAVRIAHAGRAAHARAGAGRGVAQADRRPAPAERRNRRLPDVHHAPRRHGRRTGREVPLQHADRAHSRWPATASPA